MSILDTASTPTFEVHVREVSARVRSALAEALSAVGADATRPQTMARKLGLDKSLAWKTSRLVSEIDPFAALEKLPGRSGQKILLTALEKAGAATQLLAQVREAMEEFEHVIELHAGDRDTLEMMTAHLARDASIERDEAHRRLAYQGNSAIFGVQADAQITAHFVVPAEKPGHALLGIVTGPINLRRLRPQTPWAVARITQYTDKGVTSLDRSIRPLDPSITGTDGPPLMRDFCSTNMPALRSVASERQVRYEITDGPVGNTGAVSCITGWYSTDPVPLYKTPDDSFGEHLLHLSTPTELLIFDLLIHESLARAVSPSVHLYSHLPGGPQYPKSGRDAGKLPMNEVMNALGQPADFTVPELPRHRAVLEYATNRLGHQLREFVGYRVRMRYPPIPTAMLYRHELPEAPA